MDGYLEPISFMILTLQRHIPQAVLLFQAGRVLFNSTDINMEIAIWTNSCLRYDLFSDQDVYKIDVFVAFAGFETDPYLATATTP